MSIGAVTNTAVQGSSNLGMQEFLKILLAQLTYQDPMKPMDNQAFMAQMAQFTSLQQTQETNEKIGTLISMQSALQSVALIGKTVDVATANGSVTGTVTGLSFAGALPTVSVNTAGGIPMNDISLSQINAVRPAAVPAP